MAEQLDFMKAEINRDNGMNVAVLNADDRRTDWAIAAYEHLELFLYHHQEPFMAEEARVFAEKVGFPEPPSKRAWGAIMIRAKNRGLIEFVCYHKTSNPKANATPAAVWRKK